MISRPWLVFLQATRCDRAISGRGTIADFSSWTARRRIQSPDALFCLFCTRSRYVPEHALVNITCNPWLERSQPGRSPVISVKSLSSDCAHPPLYQYVQYYPAPWPCPDHRDYALVITMSPSGVSFLIW